jgi:hypothetical protein
MNSVSIRLTLGASWILQVLCLDLCAAEEPMARRFAEPPAQSRILKIIHSWPDDASAQDNLIRVLTRQGFGGVVCNVSFEDYLKSDAKWQSFGRAVGEAKKAGWALWLYDERGYPSGTAGGAVLSGHPEWEAQGLLIADAETRGESVSLTLPPGKPFAVSAFPVHQREIDIARKIDLWDQVRDGRLNWQPPAGRWQVLAVSLNRLYEGTHAQTNLADHIPYINLLVPEPTARFLELTHGQYANRLGSKLGEHFVSTFTDEPSLMSLFLRPMAYRVLPWAPNLPGEFRKRRGYAIEPIVPELVLEAGPRGQRHRYDFWLTIAELVSENYFGQIQSWCHEHGVRSGGHLLMEEGLVAHVPLYGDFVRSARRLDAPSIDCLSSLPPEVPWFIARLLASAAELEGKTVVMSETSDHAQRYRPPGDHRPVRDVTEAEIRGTLNRLFVGGVNCITSYYSFAGLSDEALQRLNTWTGRCCAMLTGGHQAAQIALVYPVQSVWPRFVPSREWTKDAHAAAEIEHTYRAAMDSLFNARRDFTIIDAQAITESTVRDGELVHGPLRWRVVVFPAVDTLPLTAWTKLAQFVHEGGVLVALDRLPANSEADFPATRVQAMAREIFGAGSSAPRSSAASSGGGGVFLPRGSGSLLPTVLDGVLEPDLVVPAATAPLRMTHRRIEGQEIYFVINDSPKAWGGEVSFAATGTARRWDPASGKGVELETGHSIPLALEGYGAAILEFSSAGPSRRQRLQSGDLPGLTLKALLPGAPSVAHGEHNTAAFAQEAAVDQPGRPAFRVLSRIRQTKVDAFAFLRFHYEPPIDMSTSDCLVIDSWIPEGQRTRAKLLVILHESGGGDFIADTGRSLGSAGHARSFIPLSQFQQAGWTRDADGVLDARHVSDLSLGWGGYLGTEGEQVQFEVATPQCGAIKQAMTPP